MTTLADRTAPAQTPVSGGIRSTVAAYVALTKPRIIELLLVTTVPTMVLAEGGMPSLGLVLATLAGGTLAAGSANALNCVVDADIDARNWDDVAWALSTRMDPARDVTILDRTPMDYLDFASPVEGLAGTIGIDATTKIGTETARDWGQVMALDPVHEARAAELLAHRGLAR